MVEVYAEDVTKVAVTTAEPEAEPEPVTARTRYASRIATKHPRMMFRLGVVQVITGVLAVLLLIFAIASLAWDDNPVLLTRISAISSVPLFIHSLATGIMHIFATNRKLKRKRFWVVFTAIITILASVFNGFLVFMAIAIILTYYLFRKPPRISANLDLESDDKETILAYVSSLRVYEFILATNCLELFIGITAIVTSILSVGLYLCETLDV